MSTMIPPDTIPLPDRRGGADSLSSPRRGGDPTDHLEDAIDSLTEYLKLESDAEDKAAGAKILSELQKLLAAQQKLVDRATGAGPGAALVRKLQGRERISSGY